MNIELENAPSCQHCNQPGKLTTGNFIYPHRPDLYKLNFWHCEPCNAYVGCHRSGIGHGNGTRPLGTLANAELRKARKLAHLTFDKMWKSCRMKRTTAYKWLSRKLGLSFENTHIGLFNIELCKQVIAVCEKLKHKL